MEYELDHPHPSTRFEDPRTEPGELLWPERFSQESVEELKDQFQSWGGSYAQAGQLQQRPAPRGGGMFHRKDFQFVDAAPEKAVRVRGWDLAATKDGHGAFTVGLKMSMDAHKNLYVEDVRRGRWSPGEVDDVLRQCCRQDGHGTKQSLPQDPGQAGKSQRSYLAKLLHGWPLHFSRETGSKEDRARPLAAQAESGNLYVVRGPWNDQLISEFCSFPAGEFKDQVDAGSRAYALLVQLMSRSVGIVAPRLYEA